MLSRENLHAETALRQDLASRFGTGAHLIDGLGAVSAIGSGINASYRNLLAGSACLRAHGLRAHSVATSSFRITWLVERARLPEAVRALHLHFVEGDRPAPVL